MGSKYVAKYGRIGQAYHDAAVTTRQEFDMATQRAQKELQGLEGRCKACEAREGEMVTGVEEQQKIARPKGTATWLSGRAGEGMPMTKSTRDAF